MPKPLVGSWCWDPPVANNVSTYHRCDTLSGGEDFELKSHGMADEGTIGRDDWHLTKVAVEKNVYVLEFTMGKDRNRARVTVNPILDRTITVEWSE
jgi:hypothetical protein